MINLENTTFIIPVCIESIDRLRNAKITFGYLNKYFKVRVIIHELFNDTTKLDFLNLFENLKITHVKEKSDLKTYHRTRQLNEMLDMVETKVVANYDVDVLLPINSYIISINLIEDGEFDVIYPYGDGMYQKKIHNLDIEKFNFELESLSEDYLESFVAKCGHCVFLNTQKYKDYGGENEGFIAYGPEDFERCDRFCKLGLKVGRINNLVYHIEHSRTSFSDTTNNYFTQNTSLYNTLKRMNKYELLNYYENIEYKKKYKNFK